MKKRSNRKKAKDSQGEAGSVETFDFKAWKKKILDDPLSRAVVEDFLNIATANGN